MKILWLPLLSLAAACGAPDATPSKNTTRLSRAAQFVIDVDPSTGEARISSIGASTSGIHEQRPVLQDGVPGNPAPSAWELETTSARLPGQGGCPAGTNCFRVTARNAEVTTSFETLIRIDSISPASGRALVAPDGAPFGSGLGSNLGIRQIGDVPAGGTVANISLDITIPDLSGYRVIGSLWRRAEPGMPTPDAYWPFENSLVDATGNGHDAFAVNSPSFFPGAVGRGVFVTANNYYQVPFHPVFQPTSTFTVAAWINPDFNGGAPSIFAKGTRGGPVQDWGFYMFANSELAFDFNFPSGEIFTPSSGAGITPTNFQHVAGVVDVGAGVLRFYRNGVLVSTVAHTTPIQQNPSDLVIGTDAGAPNDYVGVIDELVYYDEALTDAQVLNLFINGPL